MRSILPVLLGAALTTAAPVAALRSQPPAADLVATAAAAGNFETLLAAVRAGGLEEVLRAEGPFTVFAPTDEAFAALPEATLAALLEPQARPQLEAILRHHVVAGRVTAADALAAQTATTLAGDTVAIRLRGGRLTVAEANVVANDIEASNGLVHAIDKVLIVADARGSAGRSGVARSSADVIEVAIERGVPLFNDGQQAACAAVYEVAALGLLVHSEPSLTERARRLLETAVRGGGAPAERAWRLRAALDAAYAGLVAGGSPAGPVSSASIDEFEDAVSADAWGVVNDTVMGGVSRSSFDADGRGAAVFSGAVSLENNGGFASVGRNVEAGSLRGAAGLLLRVRGDGQRYRVSAGNRKGVSGDMYTADFPTTAGEWIEVRVPFAALERSVMGFRPPNSPPLAPARVQRIGVSIGDKQEGPFRLEIDWIRAFPPARGER